MWTASNHSIALSHSLTIVREGLDKKGIDNIGTTDLYSGETSICSRNGEPLTSSPSLTVSSV